MQYEHKLKYSKNEDISKKGTLKIFFSIVGIRSSRWSLNVRMITFGDRWNEICRFVRQVGYKSLTDTIDAPTCIASWSKILFSGQIHAGSRIRLFDYVRWTERPQTAERDNRLLKRSQSFYPSLLDIWYFSAVAFKLAIQICGLFYL